MEISIAEHVILEFYYGRPDINGFPLKPEVTPKIIGQILTENGYQFSYATKELFPKLFNYSFLFEEDEGLTFLVSKDEKMRGVLRIRADHHGNYLKIESNDYCLVERLFRSLNETS